MIAKKAYSWRSRLTAVCMAVVMLLGQGVFTKTALAADAETEGYIRKLSEQGILFGDQSGNMYPERSITRAEFVAMVNRAFGLRETSAVKFSDIKGDEWYANDINIAKTTGYFSGAERNRALPNNTLTREQATALVYRNMHYDKAAPENYSYTDSLSFSNWARDAINTATEKGFISSYSDGSFRPFQAITRGEVAKMLSVAVGDQLSEEGEKSLGATTGNVTIVNSGVTLRNTIINGDLFITEGVGLGYTTLDNVTVTGQVIVSGAGASNAGDSSILFNDCNIGTIIVDGPEDKTVALRMDGNTNIQDTKVKSNTIIEEYSNHASGFHNVILAGPEDTSLHLLGDFDKVSVMQPANYLFLDSGSIAELLVDEEAPDSTVNLYEDTYTDKLYLDIKTEVTGAGDVGYLRVNAPDCTVTMLPDIIDITPGLTARINGKIMTSKDGIQASSQPKILSQYPEMDEIAPTSAKAIYKSNKKGVLYYAVTLEDEDKLTEEEILKPNTVKTIIRSGKTNINAETELVQTISGLKVNTEYRINAVLVDERDDKSAVNRETFTTADNVKPAYSAGYPKLNSTTNTSAEFSVVTTKDATLHWAVLLKGHQAPTDIELKKDKAEGAIKKGNTKVKKNEIETFTVSGLEELENYELYTILTDGENDSKVTKTSFVTKDMTPPVFSTGYPKMDKVTEKSVVIKSKINEAGQVYYALMKRGATFPPPVEGVQTPPLTSDEAKHAVTTGNNTLKNGRTSAREEVEATTTISGLSPETTYDLYIVAEDKAKNLSDIQVMVIKTTDTIAPTATQEFEDVVEGLPEAMTEIRVVFSEEVWDSLTGKTLTPETVQDCITLYDMSAPKREAVTLDYFETRVELVDGHTVVTFPASSRPGNLRSGNKYEFELNNIVDTSGNKMQQKTKLPVFQIVAPLVELVKTVPPDNMDMTFQILPTSVDTADEILFDTLFYSDTTIKFELYEKDMDTEEFVLVTKSDGVTPISNQIWSGDGISLHYILDLARYQDEGTTEFQFEQFNLLEPREYGIRITQINSSDRSEWSGTVAMNIRCMIGPKNALSMVASAPKAGLSAALKAGAMEVHYPSEFEMTYTFLDTLVPEFLSGYPNVGNEEASDGDFFPGENDYHFFELVGDTVISPKVRTNKACTVYYLIAPKGTATLGGMRPTAEAIISNSLKPQGGISGTFIVESPKVEYEMIVENVAPETNYDMYFVLKSTTNQPSEVYQLEFRTKEVYAPTISNMHFGDVGDGYVEVIFDVDRSCTVDWIAYQSTSSGGPAIESVNANTIREKVETSDGVYKPASSGALKLDVKLGQDKVTTKVKVTNLQRNLYYTFYAVAKSPLGGQDSIIAYIENFTPADRTPPVITGQTYIENSGVANQGRKYEGQFMLLFSEPAYYITGEGGEVAPLTLSVFTKSLKIIGGEVTPEEAGSTALKARIAVTNYTTSGGSTAASPRAGDSTGLTSVVFTFRNVGDGATIFSDLEICDSSGNKAGTISITFKDNEKADGTDRGKSEWVVTVNKKR